MRSKSFKSELAAAGVSVAYLLLLVWTMLGLITMADLVAADWPGWSSLVMLW